MSFKPLIFFFTAVVLIGVIVFLILPGKERQVRKRLRQLAEYVTKEQGEPPLVSLQRGRQVSLFFKEPCRVKLEGYGKTRVFQRKEISDRVIILRNSFSWVSVDFYDIHLDFPEENTAELNMTVRLNGKTAGEEMRDVQEVEAGMEKLDGQWVFTDVTVVEVLER